MSHVLPSKKEVIKYISSNYSTLNCECIDDSLEWRQWMWMGMFVVDWEDWNGLKGESNSI